MNALVTRSDKNIKEMSDVTHPFLKEYAKKLNCDFIILDSEPAMWTDDKRPHYRILECKKLLESYDRLLLMDTDMLVLPNCPNIFDEVPIDCIGSVYEDKGTRREERHSFIKGVQDSWGNVNWKDGYTNAGTFVISKCHEKIFDSNNGEYWKGKGSVDIHLSYMAKVNNYKFYELSYKWNHMTMFSEGWNGNANRFKSYIIHYAGRGVFDRGLNRITQIKKDAKTIAEEKYDRK